MKAMSKPGKRPEWQIPFLRSSFLNGSGIACDTGCGAVCAAANAAFKRAGVAKVSAWAQMGWAGMPTNATGDTRSTTKSVPSQGEIEAAICKSVNRFEREYMGRGPKEIRAYLLGDCLLVRLQGVLTTAEANLAKTLPAESGRTLLKQVRTNLIETASPIIQSLVEEITGVEVLSMHHDFSTMTAEEVVVFTLMEAPIVRVARKTHTQ